MTVAGSLARTAVFAALYLAATVLGRLTVVDGATLAVVWPAAGMAVIWFFAQRRAALRWADVAALAAVTFLVDLATGTTVPTAAVLVVADLAQLAVLLRLVARRHPELWRSGGHRPPHSPRQLWGLLGAVLTATAGGAAIASTGIWLTTGDHSWISAAARLAGNSAGILLLGTFGLFLHGAVATSRGRYRTLRGAGRSALTRLVRGSRWRIAEYLGLAGCSAVAYYACFAIDAALPVAFPLVGVTVWAATRVPTPWVAAHGLLIGVIAVAFTLHGDGPFAVIQDDVTRVFVCQLFVTTVGLIGLAVALGRDERDATR